MKIYIKNYKPVNILKKLKLLDSYYINTKNNIEIISDEGIFYINDTKFYKMNVILDKLIELRSNGTDLLLDKSVYNNDIIHHLPFTHIITHVTTFYYAINSKSKIKLVIQGNYEIIDEEIDNTKIISNKYHNFNPINFYFEMSNEKTDFELLNNDELNVFLSVLN